MLNKENFHLKMLKKETYLYGFLFGLLGAFTNLYFNFELYGQLTLHLGQSFVFLCLLMRGFPSALVAASITNGSLWYLTGNPYFFLTLNLEFLVVALLIRKKTWILNADILYWFIVGLPTTYAILLFVGIPEGSINLILSKQLVNAVLYSTIAVALFYIVPSRFVKKKHDNVYLPLEKIIFRLCVITISLPSLIIVLQLTQNSVEQLEELNVNKLTTKAIELKTLSEQYIVRHQLAVDSLATALVNTPKEDQHQLLSKYQTIYPGFLTMLIANAQGKVTNGAPASFYNKFQKLPVQQKQVEDRSYFSVPKETLTSYISKVFTGRGFGSDKIIAVSSPIIKDQRFIGIAEGSLNLPSFAQLESDIFTSKNEEFILILDSKGEAIYHSMPKDEMLNSFQKEQEENVKSNVTSNNKSFEILLTDQKYLFQGVENTYGWKIYVFQSTTIISSLITNNFYLVILSLLLIILLFLILARSVSIKLTQPLLILIEQFSKQEQDIQVDLPNNSPKEFDFLARKLKHAHNLQRDYQEHLANEVELKTRQLQQLNIMLERKARTDSLTGLYNRHSFDELALKSYQISSRENAPCAIIMLDIDHFKNINDTYGHLAGDHCIISLANMIKDFFKRNTDLIARFGGEEYILFLNGNAAQIAKRSEQLRKHIEQHIFNHEDQLFKVTISMGIEFVDETYPKDLEHVIKAADDALYQSKSNGRNQITCNKKTA